MKNIILADSRKDFINDASTRVMISYENLVLNGVNHIEEIASKIPADKPVIVAIGDSLIDALTPEFLTWFKRQNISVYGYCFDGGNILRFRNLGIPCLGTIKRSSELLEKLSADPISALEPTAVTVEQQRNPVQPQYSSVSSPQPAQAVPTPEVPNPQTYQTNLVGDSQTQPAPQSQPNPQPQNPPAQTQMPNPFSNMTMEQMMYAMQCMMANMQAGHGAVTAQPAATQAPQPSQTAAEQINTSKVIREAEQADQLIAEDLKKASVPKTIVVSTYSAKGGVGKSTLASELAACLAMTSTGRRKLRVCIVDYNIDFGNIVTMLRFNPHGATSALWASEITQRIKSGEKPEEIQYSKEEMEDNFLQCCEYGKGSNKIEIFGLIAPPNHEDSMDIGEQELEIMLNNIIQNGRYDFVICDTGNNTRDSSIIALQHSNYIFMVLTQDISTADCNDAFLNTMEKVGFDTTKFFSVINGVIPAREAGISVEEVEDAFKKYQCIGKVKRTNDIVRANNKGIPLVFDPTHEFTKQVRQIVRFITDGEVFEDDEPQKRGLFGRKKKKRG